MRFTAKAALVTGAASGIGRACARQLGAEGAALALADINIEGARAVAAEIAEAHGVAATAIEFDAAIPASCRAMVDDAVAALGKLDILFNIAGVFDWNHLTDFPDEAWDRVLAIDLSSLFHISKRAMPHLLATRGNIVNAASSAGLKGQAYCAAYTAAKHGVVGLTKSLATEFAGQGVRVNAVCPGGVKTALTAGINWVPTFSPKLVALLNAKIDGDPMSEPEEIATLFTYLASDAARYVTGAAITIDGGQLAG